MLKIIQPKPLSALLACAFLAMAPVAGFARASQPAPAQVSSQATDLGLPAYQPDALQVHKSPNDPSDYRALKLDNGLQVLLVHDPKADRSAASMTVDAGSADDPADMPGLAHFNEHMLFLGTDQYPGPTDYQDYLKDHGGKFNAGTSSQTTTYFFDINPANYQEALKRFSRFFIAPLFNAEYVDHERHAVDSEFHMRLRDDSRRSQEALNQAFNPEHPFTHFSVGNLDTLKDGDKPLRERLLDFYQHHYGANVMHLALVGPQPLDQLEQLARNLFREVPNRGLSAPKIDAPLLTKAQLPAQIQIQTLQQGQSLGFLFPIPDPMQYPLTQPDAYIANLVGHEGKGSILSVLRRAGWANGLMAGTQRSDKQHALFSVRIELTPKGAKHQDEIQATLFAYLKKVGDSLAEPWRYQEQARLLAQQYPYLQVGFGVARAAELSTAMSLMPVSEVNVAPYRMERFDPKLIRSYLEQLTPENLLRVYTGPEVKGDQQSHWYQTPYSLTRVSTWPAAKALDGLALPARDPFIAQDFRLYRINDQKPRQLRQDPGISLWYQGNDSFGSPVAEWRIHLLSPNANNELRQGLLNLMLAFWLNDQVDEALYPALLAGQSANASGSARGLLLSLAGWRDKQPEVLATLLDQLRNAPIEPAAFARLHKETEDWLINRRQQLVATTLGDAIDEHLVTPSYSLAKGQEALKDITVEDLRNYRQQWLQTLHAEVLVVGNLSEDDARKGCEAIAEKLNPRMRLAQIPPIRALQITRDIPTLRPASDHKDAAALAVRMAPHTDYATLARWMVLGHMLSGPFYSELRTHQQLGYVVAAGYRPVANGGAITALIQSPSHSSKQLFAQMEQFWNSLSDKINTLDAASLKPYQVAVVNSLLNHPQNLSELTSRQDRQLTYDQTTFDRAKRLARDVAQLSPADIVKTWQEFLAQPVFKVAHDPDTPANDKDYQLSLPVVPK